MSRCIFCKKKDSSFSAKAHILPESLGGKEWACLPPNIECDKCNQYFGSKVERPALNSFPFLPFRLLLGIPTKKKKTPKMEIRLGTLKGTPFPGTIGLDPISEKIEEGVINGQITQLRILAEPTEPLAVCQLLLKMGLEVVANNSYDDVMNPKFDAARLFTRKPIPGSSWWFLLFCNHNSLFEKFRKGLTLPDWLKGIKLETINIQGAEVFYAKFLDMSLIAPLEKRIIPHNLDKLPEPDYRFFRVRC